MKINVKIKKMSWSRVRSLFEFVLSRDRFSSSSILNQTQTLASLIEFDLFAAVPARQHFPLSYFSYVIFQVFLKILKFPN
jgi:hypothetical protein